MFKCEWSLGWIFLPNLIKSEKRRVLSYAQTPLEPDTVTGASFLCHKVTIVAVCLVTLLTDMIQICMIQIQNKPMKKEEALYLKWCVDGGEGGSCNITWQAIELTWRGRSLLTRCQQQGGHHQHRLQPTSASIPLPPLTFILPLAHLSDGPSISPSIWPPRMHHFVISREFLSVRKHYWSKISLSFIMFTACPFECLLVLCWLLLYDNSWIPLLTTSCKGKVLSFILDIFSLFNCPIPLFSL